MLSAVKFQYRADIKQKLRLVRDGNTVNGYLLLFDVEFEPRRRFYCF